MASDPTAQLRAALAGRYDVDREIGRGGMATVFLAHDLRHERKVALKLLNPELGAVLGVERFLSEIKVTANLQHPNLLPLFDSGEIDGQLFYVMPFIEGESLRARMEREKQLPVDDAVRIAIAIAGALDYAHAHDVIHRDLKPENILLQHDEPVIADFGIALAVSRAGGSRITQTGLSLGTPQYMSPEQATGDRTIDGRSDIYSLGAMLYEMLSGEPPHSGATAQAIIAKLMTDEPRPVIMLRKTVPAHVSAAVHKALQKLPADRWKTARDFAEALRGGRPLEGTAEPRSARAARIFAVAGAVAVGVAAIEGVMLARRPAANVDDRTLRFQFVTADSERFVPVTPAIPFSVSPDDRAVVYVGAAPNGRRLYVRDLQTMQTRALPNSDGGPLQPTFSPDGKSVAFVIDDRIVRTPAEGGPLTTILPLNRGGNAGIAWVDPDTLVVSVGGMLQAVPVNGGQPVVLSKPDTSRGETAQWGPRVINKRYVAYVVVGFVGMSGNRIGILDRRTGKSTVTDIPGTTVLAGVDNHVLWVSTDGSVMEAPLDASGKLGAQRRVLEDVLVRPGGAAKAALSARGTLIYHQGLSTSRLIVVDEHGVATPLPIEPRAFNHPRWSPDGSRIAVAVNRSGGSDVWVIDVRGSAMQKVTPAGEVSDQPEWTSDGAHIVYRHRASTGTTVRSISLQGTELPTVLVDSVIDPFSARPSADGKWIVLGAIRPRGLPGTGFRIAAVSTASRHATFLSGLPGQPYNPALSPDGHWLLWGSPSTGRSQVYVRSFPEQGASIQVSQDGGTEPLWSRDGHTIFYRRGRDMYAAHLAFGATVAVTGTTKLFTGDYLTDAGYGQFDVSADGRRFLMLQNVDRQEETVLIYNWAAELRKNWK